MAAHCTGRTIVKMTWQGMLVLTWASADVDESDRDMWHHCKGDTWHGLTWQVQVAWVDGA